MGETARRRSTAAPKTSTNPDGVSLEAVAERSAPLRAYLVTIGRNVPIFGGLRLRTVVFLGIFDDSCWREQYLSCVKAIGCQPTAISQAYARLQQFFRPIADS